MCDIIKFLNATCAKIIVFCEKITFSRNFPNSFILFSCFSTDTVQNCQTMPASFWMLNGSLYDMEYRDADGNWHDTRFNTTYALKALGGKEWMMGKRKLDLLNLLQTKTPFKHVYNYKENKIEYYEVG